MNHFPSGKPKIVEKAFSLVAIGALVIGGFASLISATAVYANNGLTVTANPNSGTLHAGDQLEVDFNDPSGTTDAVADSCLVNGVETKSTFANVSPGLYHVIYTVGASDTSRAAGQVPINCTLHQQNSVTITAFDDNNTVAIDTTAATSTGSTGSTGGSTGTTTPSGTTSNGTPSQNGGLSASAVPSTGTL
ncbi:MAG TPA: hypothetical protein VFT82_02290, partial [Candidatus Paceibacterota bacterium]|nr:hypothetical protein [Candidatus Paceibacterota bacterium]